MYDVRSDIGVKYTDNRTARYAYLPDWDKLTNHLVINEQTTWTPGVCIGSGVYSRLDGTRSDISKTVEGILRTMVSKDRCR
jgi:hypothetical protein